MASPLTLQVVRGAARDFQLQIASSSGSAPWSSTNPSPFLSSDTLSAVVWALWIALNRPVGLALGLLVVPSVLLSVWLVDRLSVGAVQGLAAALFVGGWVLQLLGHVYEGKKPALVDNLFQALIGPMFVATEGLIALGLAPAGLHDRIERQAALRP